MPPLILMATGHRPPKLGGYSPRVFDGLRSLAYDYLQSLPEKPEACISGMALGWDQAFAHAALNLEIPLWAYIPCPQQERMWPTSSQRDYQSLLSRAALTVTCSPRYSPACMQDRNIRMVDDSTHCLALWDGSPGGTGNCIRYLESRNRPFTNLWPQWQKGS